MIKYFDFKISLNSSWTRRLISCTDSKWKKLFESDLNVTIPELNNFEIHFVKILKNKNRKRNKFWNDVLQTWIVVYKLMANISKQCKTYQMTTYVITMYPDITIDKEKPLF